MRVDEAAPKKSLEDIIRDKLMLSEFYKKYQKRFDAIVNRLRSEGPDESALFVKNWVNRTQQPDEGIKKVFHVLSKAAYNKRKNLGEFIEAYDAAKRTRPARRTQKPKQPKPKKGFNISDLFR